MDTKQVEALRKLLQVCRLALLPDSLKLPYLEWFGQWKSALRELATTLYDLPESWRQLADEYLIRPDGRDAPGLYAYPDPERVKSICKDIETKLQANTEEPATEQTFAGYVSAADLATRHNVDPDKLRKRLDRMRAQQDSGYVETHNRGPKEPKYLYDEKQMMNIIDELKSGHQMDIDKKSVS